MTLPQTRILLALVALVVALPPLGMAGLYALISHPAAADLPLPPGHTALDSPEGRQRLARAESADHRPLSAAFQAQEKSTWCGVASTVAVLNAAGGDLTQAGFFRPEVTDIRSWWATTFTGMPLGDLAAMARAHGMSATATFAADASVEAFREVARANLASPGDWLIVNYDRAVVGEAGSGHFSPLSAYDHDTDEVLLLDTAAYKYGPHWAPLADLFAAMNTPDSESGRSRGWVVLGTPQ